MRDMRIEQREVGVLIQGFSSEAGSVLLSAMALILVSLGIIAGLVIVVPASFSFAGHHKDLLFAMYTAESGLNYSIESILGSGVGAFPLEGSVPSGGSYVVELITDSDGNNYLESTGVYNKRTKVIRVAVQNVGGVVLFPEDIVDPSDEDYELPDIVVPPMPEFPDGSPSEFDSAVSSLDSGTYYFSSLNLLNGESLSIAGPAKVFVENDLVLDGQSEILFSEDVEIYVKGDISLDNHSTIVGEGDNKLYTQGSLTLDNGAVFFAGNPSAEILVGGNIIGTNNVMMFPDGDNWNSVFVLGNVAMDNNAQVGNENLPNTVLYMPNDDSYFVLKNNGAIFGGIYLPHGVIEFKNNAVVDGSLVCKTLLYKNNCTITYNDRMLDIKVEDGSAGGGGEIGFGNWSLRR